MRTLEEIQISVDKKLVNLLQGWDRRKIGDILRPNILKSLLANFQEDERQLANVRIRQLVETLESQ